MVKHTLFLVHGMGRHPAGTWHEPIWQKLVEVSERYPFFQQEPLADWAEPVGIGYDRFIEAALKRWSDQASAFSAFAGANELRFATSLDWLAGVADDDPGFLLSHAADVVVYRFFKLEQSRIQDVVKRDVAARIRASRDQDPDAQFTVVAHSLGTAVTHDALAELGAADTLDGVPNTFSAKNFAFRSIHMLANVSRLLQTEPKVYESVVRPGTGGNSYCDRLYSPRHELDPFTLPMPYEPLGWPGYSGEVLRHFRAWDLHGFEHYLDHPRVHVPILRSVSRSTAITKKQELEAENAYPRFAGDFAAVALVQAKLGQLAQLLHGLDRDAGLAENWKTLMQMWGVLQELKEALP